MGELIFLKLGGSLITDKTGVESARDKVLQRLAGEIAEARGSKHDLHLVIGHGSGSFGHVAAARYGTRQGVASAEQWWGFAQVSAAAARLNVLVREALLAAGVPVVTLQPSASAGCRQGKLVSIAFAPIEQALMSGLVPLVYGDVAFDEEMGGTIISTEEIMTFLSLKLGPDWLMLAGKTDGVLDSRGRTIPLITPGNLAGLTDVLGGSHGTDVTGGMASKVSEMLKLLNQRPEMRIRIFSGEVPGKLRTVLKTPAESIGTLLQG